MPDTTDTEEKKTPPRRVPRDTSRRPSNPRSLHTRLETFIAQFALPFQAFGDEHCAGIIADGAPQLAESWTTLANEKPAVKRALETLLEGGAWSGVIFSTLSIAVPIMQHHGIVPPLPFGKPPVVPPTESENGATPHGPNIPSSPPPTGTVEVAGSTTTGE